MSSVGYCTLRDIDLVIVATSTPDQTRFRQPRQRCRPELGILNRARPLIFRRCVRDFVYALATADNFLKSAPDQARNVLVIGVGNLFTHPGLGPTAAPASCSVMGPVRWSSSGPERSTMTIRASNAVSWPCPNCALTDGYKRQVVCGRRTVQSPSTVGHLQDGRPGSISSTRLPIFPTSWDETLAQRPA